MNDISECLEGIRRGEEMCARELVREMHPLVMKIIRSHLPGRESEEDLAQKIYARMFLKLDQYAAQVPFQHWLSRIAVNICLNQLKHEKRRPELRQSDLTDEENQVIETLAAEETLPPDSERVSRELTEKLLACLDPDDRLLMHLMYLEGHGIREVQALTGWNSSLIKIRAYRARNRMRKCYERLRKDYD